MCAGLLDGVRDTAPRRASPAELSCTPRVVPVLPARCRGGLCGRADHRADCPLLPHQGLPQTHVLLLQVNQVKNKLAVCSACTSPNCDILDFKSRTIFKSPI